jgi:O-antigen/teichoic acid export membrane protein
MSIEPIQRQSFITFVSTITLTGIGFLSTIYFAHTLGPAPLGAYFLFLAYFGILNLIGDGGFGGAAVKRISEGKEPREYFSAFVCIRIILLAFSVSILLLAEPYFKDVTSSGMFFWLLLALIISVFSSSTAIGVYGAGKVGVYQISNFVDVLLRILFQVGGVFFGFGVAGLAGGFVGGLVAGGIVNFRHLDLKLVHFRLSHIKSLTGFSFWIFLTGSGSLVFSYADTVLIGYFMSNADVGIYRTAFQLTAVATFTTMAFHTVLYPKISSWESEGKFAAIENALSRAFTYSLLLAIPVCIGGWILGERLLFFLYGSSFTEGTPALFLLLLVQVVNVFMYLGTMGLNSLNRPKGAFLVTAVAALINIILDIALIPIMGITGAALATLIAMTLNALVALVLLSRVISVKIEYSPLKHIFYASGVMGIFLIAIRVLLPLTHVAMVFGTVLVGACIYSFILLKADLGIHDEIWKFCLDIGLPWPKWL